jgi:hypothetical protein
MRQAMNTLRQFSEKERDYHAYQARQNFLREQLTIQYELDQVHKAKLEAEKREQIAVDRERIAVAREQTALDLAKQKDLEIERLKALLAKTT